MRLRKRICMITTLFMLSSVMMSSFFSPTTSAAYLPKNSEQSNGASNIALIYTGYYNPDNYGGANVENYSKDQILPYVGYLNDLCMNTTGQRPT